MPELLCAADASVASRHVSAAALSRIRCAPQAAWGPTASQPETLWIDLEARTWRYGMSEGRSVTERDAPEFVGLSNRRAERASRIPAGPPRERFLRDVPENARLCELSVA